METQRFANLLYDESFKIVVGAPGNEPLLIHLIETLIPGKKITELTNLDKENHGMVPSDKNTTFDLFCKSENGERFIVEMQFAGHDSFRERMLVYATYPIRAQMDRRMREVEEDVKGVMDYSLHPVYVLSLLNFSLPHESGDAMEEGLVSRYDIRNARNGELMTDALHFVFLELGRLEAREDEWEKCKTPLERLAYSLKYMHLLKDRPEGYDDDTQRLLYKAGELAAMTQEQRRYYDNIMTTKFDILVMKDYARRQGLEEGMAKGKTEGRAEGKAEGIAEGLAQGLAEGKELERREIAKKLLAAGMDAAAVAAVTGLEPGVVETL